MIRPQHVGGQCKAGTRGAGKKSMAKPGRNHSAYQAISTQVPVIGLPSPARGEAKQRETIS